MLCISEHSDVLVMYLSGAGVVDRSEDREELAAFLSWHDIPHPLHLSHINYQEGLRAFVHTCSYVMVLRMKQIAMTAK